MASDVLSFPSTYCWVSFWMRYAISTIWNLHFCFFFLYSRSSNSFQSCQESLVNLLVFSHKISSMYTLTTSRLSERCIFMWNIIKNNSDGDFQKRCFPIGRKMVKKLLYFSFASSAEKYFQLCRNVVENIHTLQVLDLYRSERFHPFFYCASCSGLEVAPMIPAVSLAFLLHSRTSVLLQSSFYFRMNGNLLGIWTGGHRREAKGRQCGFLIYVLKPTEIFQSPWKTYSNAFVLFFPI